MQQIKFPAHNFAQVPQVKKPRSVFNRSHKNIITIAPDKLYPTLCEEIYPGDTVSLSANFFARLLTPLNPLLDNLKMNHQAYFVPHRLVWANWKRFIAQEQDLGPAPITPVDYVTPKLDRTTVPVGGIEEGTVYDYLHWETKVPFSSMTSNLFHNLKARGFKTIWNEHYRDQNLQAAIVVDTDDGPDDYNTYYALPTRGKRHDYLTSSLPWPQKVMNNSGIASAPMVPVSGSVDIYRTSNASAWSVYDNGTNNLITAGGNLGSANPSGLLTAASGGSLASLDPNGGLYGTIDDTTAGFLISQFRLANAIQLLYEADARGGSRYVESVLSHFGAVLPDATAQRPVFIAEATTGFHYQQIPQTSESGTTPLGTLAAFAVNSTDLKFAQTFVEHGYLFVISNCYADMTYQNGMLRDQFRSTRFDFYFPELANLSEQEVFYGEVQLNDESGSQKNTDIWAYQERWAELRYSKNRVAGQMRSNATYSYDVWHLAYDWSQATIGNAPALNGTFIQSDTDPLYRSIALTAGADPILLSCVFNIAHARVLPTYSIPNLEVRF